MSGALFQGMVMVVDLTVKNEDNQEVEEVIKKDIHACGGEVVELSALNEKADYERLTHMIVTDLDKDVVKKARGHKLKVKAVTEWWVDQCIEKNQVLPTDAEVVYCPPNALGGIPLNEMKDLVVCVTGYSGFRRVVMRELVLRTGARYSGTLNRSCTHLVCYRYEGDKYVTAKKWKDNFGAPCIVNHRWVEDCLRTWTRLSELVYEEKCGEEVDKEPRVPLKELVKLEAVQNSEDEVGSEDEEDEAGAGHRSSRYAANRHSNRQQPCKDKAQLEETVAVPDANTLKKVDPDTNRKQKQVAQVVDDPAGAPPSPLSPPEDEKEKVLELPEDTTMEMVQEIPLGEEEEEPKEIEEIVVRKKENSPPENVAEDDVARRRLRELKNLQLFSWDVQSTKFPPGEKLSNSVGNLARKRVQPERLEPENFSVEPSKKRKGMKAVNGHGKENVSTSCQQPKKRNKKGAKTNATAAKVRAMDGSKSEHFRVLLSGMRSKVRARCEKYSQKCDGVQIIESPKEWNHGTTHLVTPKLGRSEKTLAGMAAGAWILKESWLRESAKVKKALDEKKFLVESRDDTFVTQNAAELWHNRYKQTKRRAFEDMCAFFHEGCAQNAPSKDTLVRVFRAGGGKVISTMDELKSFSGVVDFAVVPFPLNQEDRVVKECLEAKILCVSDLFIIEWIAFPQKDLTAGSCHVLGNSSFANAPILGYMQNRC